MNKNIKREISEERAKMTDKEFFLSSSFKDFAESLLRGVGKIFKVPTFKVNIYWGNNDDKTTACVNERCEFIVNANNILLQGLDRKNRFPAIIGLLCHEVSHRLWTDFKDVNRIAKQITVGTVQIYEAKALNNYLRTFPEQRQQVSGLFYAVQNIIDDGANEIRFNLIYMGFRKYLTAMRNIAKNQLRELLEINGASGDTITDFLNLLLAYAVNGFEIADFENVEAVEALEFLKPTINSALHENKAKRRNEYCIIILSELINFLQQKEEQKSQPSPSNQNSENEKNADNDSAENTSQSTLESEQTEAGDNTSGTDSQSDDSEQNSSDSESSSTSIPSLSAFSNNNESEGCPDYSPLEGESENEMETNTPNQSSVIDHRDSQDFEKELNKVLDNAAKENVEKNQEKDIQKQCNTLKNNMDFGDFHKGVSSKVDRITDTTKPADFDELNKECDVILRRLIKEWAKQIHDLQIGSNMNGLYSGRRLKQAYRTDLKRFSSKKAPEDIPDMSICLLIDMSGSMSGNSIMAARKSAMLIYKFCQEMDIRVSVLGHQVRRNVKLSSFADFDSIDGKDIFRLANIDNYVGGCNRDGYAIRYCVEKLSKEQAAQKMLIIISDGAPNDDGYGFYFMPEKDTNYQLKHSGNAKLDIMEIEKLCAKQGISIITAGIGYEADEIKDLYEYGVSKKIAPQFLEITDLSKMPKQFVQILKKEIDKYK